MTSQFSTAPQGRPLAAAEARPVDVLILTALQDELEAVRALADGWVLGEDTQGLPFYLKSFKSTRGEELRIVAAWTGEMGPVDAARRADQLVRDLDPGCLAMCGICAGCRDKVALGDVIIADRLYRCDVGKLVAGEGMFHDLRTFDLAATWKMDAAFLARELDTAALAKQRPVSSAAQRRWMFSALRAEQAGGPAASSRAERKARCPDWPDVVEDARRLGWVEMRDGKLSLSQEGQRHARPREGRQLPRICLPPGPRGRRR